jgi:membrane protein
LSDDQALADASFVTRYRRKAEKWVNRTRGLLQKDIWELENLGRRTVRARGYYLLRIITLTFQGLRRNQLPMQSAALTFYSSIGIGPLIAFGIMISGFLLDRDIADAGTEPGDSVVVEKITEVIAFAAPQVAITVEADGSAGPRTELDPKLIELISNFSEVAKSGTVGVVGTLVLLVILLRVLISIETSFNSLWGVAKGRLLSERIITYWTFVSLGAVLGTAAISIQALNLFIEFAEQLPFGAVFAGVVQFFLPLITIILITLALAAFLRFMPNIQVRWRPAVVGAVFVVVMLELYRTLSFLYVQQVVSNKSLYGSVGIIVVLMLGLYVFWLLILLGGQITYAVQNADFLTNENAWQKTSERARELISLAVVMLVMRRFQSGEPPLRTSELLRKLRIPSHILNSSLQRLCALGYLIEVEAQTRDGERDHAYQPGCPAENIRLADFKQKLETFGNDEGSHLVLGVDPAVTTYLEKVLSLEECPTAALRLSDLMRAHQ